MDQPKVERMLRLMALMSGTVDYTVEELARRLETSSRSIYRYIDTFKSCGFVVDKLAPNVYKLKTLPKEYPDFSKLVYFSDEEAYLVNSLMDRLDPSNALKANLQKKLAVIYDIQVLPILFPASRIRPMWKPWEMLSAASARLY